MLKRCYYVDRYNKEKVWCVTKLKGGYYVHQFIRGKLYGRGARFTKTQVEELLEK